MWNTKHSWLKSSLHVSQKNMNCILIVEWVLHKWVCVCCVCMFLYLVFIYIVTYDTYVHMYVGIYIYIHVCIWSICVHTHTHTQTYIYNKDLLVHYSHPNIPDSCIWLLTGFSYLVLPLYAAETGIRKEAHLVYWKTNIPISTIWWVLICVWGNMCEGYCNC